MTVHEPSIGAPLACWFGASKNASFVVSADTDDDDDDDYDVDDGATIVRAHA